MFGPPQSLNRTGVQTNCAESRAAAHSQLTEWASYPVRGTIAWPSVQHCTSPGRAIHASRFRGALTVAHVILAESRSYFLARAFSAYFFWNRSTRPAVSTSFCLPVKKGWQFEQISTRIIGPLK